MRELSAATVLALHALQAMMLKGTPVSIPELARSSGSAAAQIRPLLAKLQREGLIQSRPGHGFLLARSPGDITLHEIIQAIGESRPPAAPCGGDFDACDSRASCILVPLCRKAEEGFRETLRTFTLAELRGAPLDLPNCVTPGR
jgi:Rrf2 family iron-sulfur cluster assembly transcriptional regulator